MPPVGLSDVIITKYSSTATCIGLSEGEDYICPAGYFCEEGIKLKEEGRCPKGTFSDITGLANISQCSACPSGKFCSDVGLTKPSGTCQEGYYCSTGSASPVASLCDLRLSICDTPSCVSLQSRSAGLSCGGLCPNGTYCPRGTGPHPIKCPRGKYSAEVGNWNFSQCLDCVANYYCPHEGVRPFCASFHVLLPY